MRLCRPLSALAIWLLLVGVPTAADDEPARYPLLARAGDRTEWVAADGSRVAHGAGRNLLLADRTGRRIAKVGLPESIADGVLLGGRLFLARAAGGLDVLDWQAGDRFPRTLRLEPPLEAGSKLARAGDLLLVAESSRGLRILRPVAGHAHHGDSGAIEVTRVAELPLPEPITALSGVLGGAFVALAGGDLLEIDLRDPAHPLVTRIGKLGSEPRAIAANGSVVYALTRRGLGVLPRRPAAGPLAARVDSSVRGDSLAVVGRVLHVGAGAAGLLLHRDRSPEGMTFEVTVANNFFQPENLEIDVGDNVSWTNLSGFHNVFSCVPSQNGCAGQTSNEVFGNGPPADPIWVFGHTFVAVGFNPYICQSHAPGMIGLVTAGNPSITPPVVPDGEAGDPMRVGKTNATGSNLALFWDAATCTGASGHHLIYGVGSALPVTQGATYSLSGSRCFAGPGGTLNWLFTPPAENDVSGLLWWVMVADDNDAIEGSWGTDSSGNERQSPAPDGASGECGFSAKDLTNSCGESPRRVFSGDDAPDRDP